MKKFNKYHNFYNQQICIKKYISTNNSDVTNNNINNSNYLFFLGGFVEGEGSNSISVSVNKNFKYGVSLQPVFNVAQHKNGLKILYSFKELFGVGSIVQKSGSEDV